MQEVAVEVVMMLVLVAQEVVVEEVPEPLTVHLRFKQ